MAVMLDVAPGQSVTIGSARVTVIEKSGRRTRLQIESPDDVHLLKSGTAPLARAPIPEPSTPPAAAPAAPAIAPKLYRTPPSG